MDVDLQRVGKQEPEARELGHEGVVLVVVADLGPVMQLVLPQAQPVRRPPSMLSVQVVRT